ncbi:hypothetical protein [Salinispora oceanensis]|uniref:hypothetical protein n=1 Tax=Salinispora oceanensis TaxID=1050199 RepID=UPI00037E2D4E|nr:hypothetical protein [Salinispora oceanensis]
MAANACSSGGDTRHGRLASWFFVRKTPQWRLRYLPTEETSTAREHLFARFDALISEGHPVLRWS